MNKSANLIFLSVSSLFCAFLFYVSFPFRVGVAPDSTIYLSMAEHLIRGEGFYVYLKDFSIQSDPMTAWPPLLSVLLWAMSFLGLRPADAGWVVNILLCGATLWMIAFMIHRFTQSKKAALFALGILILGSTWRTYYLWVLAEPLYLFLIHLSILSLWFYFEKGSRVWYWVAVLSTGLIPMARYTGIANVGAAVLAVWILHQGSWKFKSVAAVTFGSLSSIPTGLWILRNYYQMNIVQERNNDVFDAIFGSIMKHEEARNGLWRNVKELGVASVDWIREIFVMRASFGITLSVILVLLCIFIYGMWQKSLRDESRQTILPTLLLISGLACPIFVVTALTFCSFYGGIPQRYLVNGYMHFLVLGVLMFSVFFKNKGMGMPKHLFSLSKICILVLFSLWFLFQGGQTCLWAVDVREYGIDESQGKRYRHAMTKEWFPTRQSIRQFRMTRTKEAHQRGMLTP